MLRSQNSKESRRKSWVFDGDLDALKDAIRDAFQQAGFFKATVGNVDVSLLDKNAEPPTVTVTARIEEGYQYRLKDIEFSHNNVITGTQALRHMIPMRDREIFDTESVRKGIKNLRDAYATLGYINFTPIPDTEIDDKNHTGALKFDLDEGKQFYVRSFDISGVDPERKRELLDKWKLQPGSVFNQHLIDLFFIEANDLLPPGAGPENNLILKQDTQQGLVEINLDLTAEHLK